MERIDIRITSENSDNLNKEITKQVSPMPSVESLKYDMNGCCHFSKVDIRDAFLTMELDDSSKNLTILSTPWGLLRYATQYGFMCGERTIPGKNECKASRLERCKSGNGRRLNMHKNACSNKKKWVRVPPYLFSNFELP